MSQWEKHLQYLFESEQLLKEAGFRVFTMLSAAGSLYTAVVPATGGHLHISAFNIYNPGAAAVIRGYDTQGTALSNLILTVTVPAADHKYVGFAADGGIRLNTDIGLVLGVTGSNQPVETIVYGHRKSAAHLS